MRRRRERENSIFAFSSRPATAAARLFMLYTKHTYTHSHTTQIHICGAHRL